MKKLFLISILCCFSFNCFSQDDEKLNFEVVKDSTFLKPYTIDPLAPSKAAFYSAILPGMGQVYNKKYWKVPFVYAGMGASIYYYSLNNRRYHEYRDAYKDKLAGRTVTGKLAELDPDRLIRGQKFYQKNRDLSMLITIGLYILNIVEANVNAHLMQFNVNENLSLRPELQQNEIDNKHNMVLSLSYQF